MVSDQQLNTSCPTGPLTRRSRLLGILPLTFFLAQAVHYWQIDQLGHLLWMCNVGNLLLAVGLFLDQPVMIRVAGIWSIPGLVVWWRYVFTEWFHYATLDWYAVMSGTMAHIGGLAVGLLSLRRVRVDRLTWLYAFAWYLAIQFISRLITPAELNVNLSFRVYESWQTRFDSYWKFWLVLTIVGAAILWLTGWFLKRIWPCPSMSQFQAPQSPVVSSPK
jgi:hypothetical protein